MRLLAEWLRSLSVYQLLTPLLATVIILSLVSRRRRREIGAAAFLLGVLIWAGAALASLFPDRIMASLSFMGIKEGIRTLIFFGFVVLFFTVYRLLLHVEKLEHDLTLLTRELAVRSVRHPQPAHEEAPE